MQSRVRIRGLYAVTPDVDDTAALTAMVRQAIEGGAALVQYRSKQAVAGTRLAQAQALQRVCRELAVPLIVNDHLGIALATGADGLHLGAEDGPLDAARARLGPAKLLGASCYDRLDAALAAQATGADYCAFGSFFPSGVKPGALRASLDLLREAKRSLRIPVVAIGGITLANAGQLVAAGADALAVISALFHAPDVRAAAREFSRMFETVPAKFLGSLNDSWRPSHMDGGNSVLRNGSFSLPGKLIVCSGM